MPTKIEWPNRLGWDVGAAEVRDLSDRLRVFVPMPSRYELAERASGGRVEVRMVRVADVPLGTDPLDAVTACRESGLLYEEAHAIPGPVPMLAMTQTLDLRGE